MTSLSDVDQTSVQEWVFERLLPSYLSWKGLDRSPDDLTLDEMMQDYLGDDRRYITPQDLYALWHGEISLATFKKYLEERWLADKVLPLYQEDQNRVPNEQDFVPDDLFQAFLRHDISFDELCEQAGLE